MAMEINDLFMERIFRFTRLKYSAKRNVRYATAAHFKTVFIKNNGELLGVNVYARLRWTRVDQLSVFETWNARGWNASKHTFSCG